jgi:hypothetical protein
MDFINTHTGTIGVGGLTLGWLTGNINAHLQAAVLLCTLIITAPKAWGKLMEWRAKYWPRVRDLVAKLIA